VPAGQLPAMLGITAIEVQAHPAKATLHDTTLAQAQAGPSVDIRDYMFEPMALAIAAGQTVTWKNLDEEPHVVVDAAGGFRLPFAGPRHGRHLPAHVRAQGRVQDFLRHPSVHAGDH